jgi:hypothetical protein
MCIEPTPFILAKRTEKHIIPYPSLLTRKGPLHWLRLVVRGDHVLRTPFPLEIHLLWERTPKL